MRWLLKRPLKYEVLPSRRVKHVHPSCIEANCLAVFKRPFALFKSADVYRRERAWVRLTRACSVRPLLLEGGRDARAKSLIFAPVRNRAAILIHAIESAFEIYQGTTAPEAPGYWLNRLKCGERGWTGSGIG